MNQILKIFVVFP